MTTVLRNRVCKVCGSDKFTRDLLVSSGDISCTNCGSVVEENPIVSEVQFGESASGAAMVQGAMVGADQARANFNMRNAMESREQTLLNAKKKIKKIASVMRIPDYIVESASGWFKLALVQNFVQGRRSQNVIAACLYVACRHEKTHHLLIDFSSRLQISVYSLGSTYLKLVRALQIQKLPIADPSLFIQHFADRLQFGDKTAKVCKDATKLAQRMSLDWIYEGRRPAGIAGACILIAARMNHINRSHAEIVAVARVGEETIQKRLNEFKKTTSGKLKISEFRESQNLNDSVPPSFEKNRRIELKVREFLLKREKTLSRLKELAKQNSLAKELSINLVQKEETENEAGDGENGDSEKADGSAATETTEAAPTEPTSTETASNETTENVTGENPTAEAATTETGSTEAAESESTESFTSIIKKKSVIFPESDSSDDDFSDTDSEAEAENNGQPKGASGASETQSGETEKTEQTEKDGSAEKSETTEKDSTENVSAENSTEKDSADNNSTANTAEKDDSTENTSAEKNSTEKSTEVSADKNNSTETSAEKSTEKSSAENSLESSTEKATETDKSNGPQSETLFVEADFDYDELPDNPHDETFRTRASVIHNGIRSERARNLRKSTALATEKLEALAKELTRLNGLYGPDKKEMKKRKPMRVRKSEEERENSLLRAVLDGGSFNEEELEQTLDRFLKLNQKSLSQLTESSVSIEEMRNTQSDAISEVIERNRPRNLVLHNPTTADILSKVRDDRELDENDDDADMDTILLLAEQREEKERIWIAINYDFLIAQEKKRLKMEADELTGNTSGQPRKRRKVKEQSVDAVINDPAVADALKQIGEDGKAMTPAESAKQIFQKKAFSRKINYGSITELFNS